MCVCVCVCVCVCMCVLVGEVLVDPGGLIPILSPSEFISSIKMESDLLGFLVLLTGESERERQRNA